MPTQLSPSVVKALETRGVAITGDIGGLIKKKYWTPDGREIQSIPAIRTYNRIVNGKVVASGERDANLDKGWLLEKPNILKPHCPFCNKWHDTAGEIKECGERKRAFAAQWEKKARRMRRNDDGGDVGNLKFKEEVDAGNLREEVTALKSDMADIKNMLAQLLKKES